MDKIAVIIVTYNGIKWIEKCLDHALNSTVEIKVYVIDNGSSDGTLGFIKENYPQVEIIESTVNLGFGKANNLAISKAIDDGYTYFFLLNQDGYVETNTIRNLVEFSKSNPTYGILSPIQRNGNGDKLDFNFSKLMRQDNCPGFINDSYFKQLKAHYDVKFVMAAFWLINIETIRSIGVFNPVFPHYGEDNDYANRVLYHGKKIGIVTSAIANHDREFRENSLAKDIYIYYINKIIKLSDLRRSFYIELLKAFISTLYNISFNIFRKRLAIEHIKCFHNIVFKNIIAIYKQRDKNK